MRIGLLSDIHGNLPALRVILEKFDSEKCDYIYCLGDIIAIGPFSKECVELLLTLPNIKFVMGNHEEYFLKGVEDFTPEDMSEGEKRHQIWIADSLNDEIKESMSKFHLLIEENIKGVKAAFVHYALNNKDDKKTFKPLEKSITKETMDSLFKEINAEVIFYGHEHAASNIRGAKNYINVGSSGCTKEDYTHCTIVDFKDGDYDIKVHKLEYDRDEVLRALSEREVPERDFIARIFFGVDFLI